ncbi:MULTISPECIES: ATP phosphoribosyltransferase [unclassified Anaerobiospirillum]|uniref:ATP phosphoribosyltransferase n=1 Tax=unclassified Anaerobiospirillum TaxID=2647410 RepID=UPI001FF333F4|nr:MULTISPECIES: ATP phosphoribosyltransferase [unclassified Anaerobiospirillum]MCK0526108.1 ATP phosphoribosyltransferase [Anaerobiospirillum sp. NML120449]MCK0534891.1 ATP phosphoribosyltransferase [Anaerobiospirillum sp. NML120511]MCK0540073.1 ATP phosphoribosyltransferase [Anaerobiospirillum sp. NML02-A-032]
MSTVNDQSKKRLRIAMQKSGRLTDMTERLFKSCGIKINENRDHLLAHAENMPIDILRVRDDDIPGLVMDHVVDWGIVGQNVLEETAMQRKIDGLPTGYSEVCKLRFGDCRLALAIPAEQDWNSLKDLEGKKIATSYPHLLRRALSAQGVNFKSVLLTGSVEVAPRAGLADAICDLVVTGATLQANGLREVETIYESQAVIIGRDQELFPEKKALADKILTRLNGVLTARDSKYIMMNAPRSRLKEITALLPGAENPSIIELEGDSERVAMHVVSREKVFWETMESLKELGATSILVVPIEKMLD